MSTEPVRVIAAIKTLVGAVLGLLVLFGVHLSADQVAGILLVYTAGAGVVDAVFTRSKVTPLADGGMPSDL